MSDIGCEFQLDVDADGGGLLRVTSGWVAFERDGREATVPAGAHCATRRNVGPGTPYFPDSSPALREALARIDFADGGSDELEVILTEAREPVTLTLWHLLARVDDAGRRRVYERLAAMAPPPPGVTRADVAALDKLALERWREQLEITWFR